MSTTARELCGVIFAPQTNEHYTIGSPHPVYLYTDHNPLLYLWGRRGKLSNRFFRYQFVISQFQNFKNNLDRRQKPSLYRHSKWKRLNKRLRQVSTETQKNSERH